MKKSTLLYLLLGLVMLSSCGKEDEFENKTIIQGDILEYGTEEPLTNLPIYLLQLVSGGVFEPQSWRTVDTIYTDENGHVYYEYNHNRKEIDLCSFAQSNRHFEIEEKVVNTRQVNDISQLVDPRAWFKIHVKNVTQETGDLIDVSGPWGGGSNWDMFYGSSVDTMIIRKIRGNKDTAISWLVQRNGANTKLRDTIYTPGHDTTFYEILY